jgi:hypothetical protein
MNGKAVERAVRKFVPRRSGREARNGATAETDMNGIFYRS